MSKNADFKKYLEAQAETSLTSLFSVANLFAFVAFTVDIIYAPSLWDSPEWKVIFYSLPFFIICLVFLALHLKKKLHKFCSPISSLFGFGLFYSSITWIGTVMKLNYFQAIYVALMTLALSFFLFSKRHYLILSSLTVVSYIFARTITPTGAEFYDVWVSLDLLVAFTFVLGFPILTGRLRHFEIFFNNITTIEEQKSLNIYASKMSALGEMAAGMAHEINNPLAIVSGMAFQITSYIDRDVEDKDKKIKDSALRITQTVNRIAKIISALRVFSRNADTVIKENIYLEKIVSDTLDLCRLHLEEKGIHLSVIDQSTTKNIMANPVAIMQILLNLINNSVDAISELAEKWIQIQIAETSKNIQICIVDSGLGIPTENQDKIMQPFFTTKSVGQGTGLGLSISKGLAESLGGSLYLSKDSEHTSFVLELPK